MVLRLIIKSFDFWFLSIQGAMGAAFAATLASSLAQICCCFSFWLSIQTCLLRDAIFDQSFRVSLTILALFQSIYLLFLAMVYGLGYCGDQVVHVSRIEASLSSLLGERCLILAVFFFKFFVQNVIKPDRLMLTFSSLKILPRSTTTTTTNTMMTSTSLPAAAAAAVPPSRTTALITIQVQPSRTNTAKTTTARAAAEAEARNVISVIPQEQLVKTRIAPAPVSAIVSPLSLDTLASTRTPQQEQQQLSYLSITPFPLPHGTDDLDQDVSILSTFVSPRAHHLWTRFLETKPVAIASFVFTAGSLVAMCLTFINATSEHRFAILGIWIGTWVTCAWMPRYHPGLIRIVWTTFQTWFLALQSLVVIGLSATFYSDEPILFAAVVMTMIVMIFPASTRDAAVSPSFRKRLFAGFILSSGYPVFCSIVYAFEFAGTQTVTVSGRKFQVHSLIADRYLTITLFVVKSIAMTLLHRDRLVTVDWPLQIVRRT